MLKLLPILVFLISLFIIHNTSFIIHARTTPQDIKNQQQAEYNQKINNYTPENKQKIETYSQKIADLNAKITKEWEENLLRQGQILEEYTRRKDLKLKMGSSNGINRNLSDPIENAQYWLNYAHEAVAYQAAGDYIINLSGEKNINSDISSKISALQSDINGLRGKVLKSQQIIANLVE
jgi:hypothetical protein